MTMGRKIEELKAELRAARTSAEVAHRTVDTLQRRERARLGMERAKREAQRLRVERDRKLDLLADLREGRLDLANATEYAIGKDENGFYVEAMFRLDAAEVEAMRQGSDKAWSNRRRARAESELTLTGGWL